MKIKGTILSAIEHSIYLKGAEKDMGELPVTLLECIANVPAQYKIDYSHIGKDVYDIWGWRENVPEEIVFRIRARLMGIEYFYPDGTPAKD